MVKHVSLRFFAFCALAVPAASLRAAVADFTATTVPNWNGREGVTFVRYVSKDSSKVYGSAFVFDLSKGYRLKAWLGDSNTTNGAPASVGAMAEAIWASEGVAPIAGINGDYFDTSASYPRPTGMVISDSDLVSTGFGRVSLTANCYLAETGDHNLHHGKLDCVEGLVYGGQPVASWQLNARGRKVRNAIRTNYCNYPVRGGVINPVGSSSGESAFSTTIGNKQNRNYYYRTLVGFGTNAVGVATNLVLFSNTVYNGVLGIGESPFEDVDAYQIMIDLGCNEVGELDGGDSATIWSETCTTLQNFFKGGTTAHGGYVNAYRDDDPREIACGLFVMPPPAADTVALNDVNGYPDMDEAMLAAVPGDSITTLGAKPRHGTIVDGSGGARVAIEWAPDIVFGGIAGEAAPGCTNGLVTVRVSEAGTHLADGCKLRLTVSTPSGSVLGTIDRTLSGAGNYLFDTAGVIDPAAFGDGLLFDCSVALLDPAGAAIASAATARGALRLADDADWFSADAATGTAKGGAWAAEPRVLQADGVLQGAVPSAPVWSIQPTTGTALFEANSVRDGIARLTFALHQHGGYQESELPALLAEAVASGSRAALVSVQEEDGTASLRGLARVGGAPAWVKLGGMALTPGADISAAIDLDLTGETPLVSYLAGGASRPGEPLYRLRSAAGDVWLPACAAARPEDSPHLAGGVAFSGLAEVAAFAGSTAIPGRVPSWRDKAIADGRGAYAVALLGDTHFEADPVSVYHAAYDNQSGLATYIKNADMWQERMPSLLAASASVAGAGELPTRFVLQLGDIVNGDCNDDDVHLRYLKDALAATRAPYGVLQEAVPSASAGGSGEDPVPLPFLTVLGNHDFRGCPNGRKIYFEWAEPLLSRELGERVAYPLFSFRIDDDRWIFCDFEKVSLFDVAAEIESDTSARYVFLVTHGPFTACEDDNNWVWRLSAWKGKGGTGLGVPELFEAISRRRAIVLSGHTHYTTFYRNENQFGGYTELTASSVWLEAARATAEPFPGHDNPSTYGTWRREKVSAANRAAYDADIAFFKAGLREYFLGQGAGHYRLEVTDGRVLAHFYPGDATTPARTFDLTPGPPRPTTVFILH